MAFFSLFKNVFFRRRFAKLSAGALPQEVLLHLGEPLSKEETTIAEDSPYLAKPILGCRIEPGVPCTVWRYQLGAESYVVVFVQMWGSWRLAGNHAENHVA